MSRSADGARARDAARLAAAKPNADANDASWPLRPGAARTFYNVADAWLPPEAGDRDLVAALASSLPELAERARLARALAWLEWSPRLLLHSSRGLSWLPREERRAWLDRLTRRGPFRAAARRVQRAVVQAGHAAR